MASMRGAVGLLTCAVALASCNAPRDARTVARDASADSVAAPPGTASFALRGAGATFPYPLYARWITSYGARTGERVGYRSVGSGAGARQLAAHEVDFAVTESPASDTTGTPVIYVPMVAGAVAVTYNLPGLGAPLRVSGPLLADIWLGRVTRWDDARIRALNPGLTLPAGAIQPVARADESGTTFVVTSYLAAVSRAWATAPGVGTHVRWPAGKAVGGNEGVSGTVKETVGAIGFVELAYAQQNRLPVASLRNAAGAFIEPSAAATEAALESVVAAEPPGPDARMSLVDAPGARSYPLVTLSWLVVPAATRDSVRRAALSRFVHWALDDGDGDARALNYAPLPAGMATRALARVDSVLGAPAAARR